MTEQSNTENIIIASTHNDELHKLMQSWRRNFHQHPETAFEEVGTAEKIVNVLRSFNNIEVHTGLAKTGVVGVLTGNLGDNGKMVGLRADIDALNISEENNFKYCSEHQNKMHACGHDGHTTMLLGAAKYLSETPHFAGKVVFIFQPAEENAGGGEVMCKDGLFELFPCDSVYGMHNWPGLDAGKFIVHKKEVMAATQSLSIQITGKGSHAAMPHLGNDPIIVASHLIQSLQTIVSRNICPTDTAVVSVTKINAGSAFNIIPERVELNGTIRTFSQSVTDILVNEITKKVTLICESMGAVGEVEFHDKYPATINHPEYAKICAEVVTDLVGKDNVGLEEPPSMTAEDFSYMLQEKPGAYIWIGNGNTQSLHHSQYDFNDDILPLGVNYWVNLAMRVLAK